ncbi:tetratricopeptide repeat protein [Nannocystis radixulma]|uniref:Tetratricopeptide repeat protein n=1 Tax=Nannocystis radixulma TaxID=2995305 RepID=A0ABT5BJI8_9BACT|nr:tetratricopeptide repeat protein [Nannocystis radixulma]MDC0674277.1 tetratricopeptide repeat protein [Nannocystis radixulma]
MKKPIVTLVAAAILASSMPARSAAAAVYVPIAVRAALAEPPPTDANGETFESLAEQARAKYREKDYAAAVALFERAYKVQPDPNILFNIGRIQEQANNVDAAISYYQRFIADESVDIGLRDTALQRLATLEKIVEIREKEEAKQKPKQPEPAKQPEATQPVGPQLGPQPPPGDDKSSQNKAKILRPIGYTMFGVGAALLIGGGIAGGLAKGQENKFEAAETLDDQRDAGQKGKSLAAAADGLFIAGGVMAVVGMVLLLVPKARKSKAVQAMQPKVSPSQLGLGYVYRF